MAPHCSTLPCNARTRVRACAQLRATEFCRSSCRMFSPRTMFVTGFIAGGALSLPRRRGAYYTSLVGGGDCAKTRVSPFISRFSTVHRSNPGDRSSKSSITFRSSPRCDHVSLQRVRIDRGNRGVSRLIGDSVRSSSFFIVM